MARIFSISFDFQRQHPIFLVTASSDPSGTTRYTISPMDDDLKNLLPGGKISFNTPTNLERMAEGQPKLRELFCAMARAMYQKLEHAPD